MRRFEQQVSNGIKLLNEKIPEWKSKIEVNSIRMGNCFDCILGQIYGYYYKGLEKLELNISDDEKYGFYSGSPHNDLALKNEWIFQLSKLKSN